MTLRLNGSTSGYVEIDAPAVAGSNTLTLPTGNGSADQVLSTNGSGTLSFVDRGRMTLETAKTATSTAVDFTGIPSWVKRITVMFSGVSTNGTSVVQLQLGTGSTTYVSSGYTCGSGLFGTSNNTGIITYTAGFGIPGNLAADLRYAELRLTSFSGNQWVCHGTAYSTGAPYTSIINGTVSLSAQLTAVRITTVNGTDTFDAGSINILYEG